MNNSLKSNLRDLNDWLSVLDEQFNSHREVYMNIIMETYCIFIKVLYPREIPYFSLISSNVFLYCQKMIKMNEIINSIILVVTPHQFETNTASGCVSLALIALVIFGYIFYSIVKERS